MFDVRHYSSPMNETSTDTKMPDDKGGNELINNLSLVCACIMNLMCISGIVGNSISLYIFTRSSFNKRSINVLLSALSASDLATCILAIPVFSITQMQKLVPNVPRELSAAVSLYFYPITLMTQTMSVWLLVAITIDRYLAVCHPFIVRSYCTKKRALITIAVTTVFSIAYNFIRFWEYKLTDDPSSKPIEDMLEPNLRSDKLYMLLYQNVLTLLTQFVVPLLVLCYFNFEVTRTILKAGEQRRELMSSERREHSTAKMMLFVVLVFIFCYTFSFTLNVAEIVDKELFQGDIGYLLNDINNILIVINSSTSFFFYYKYSTRYRAQLRKMCTVEWLLRRPFGAGPRTADKSGVFSECSALVTTTAVHTPNVRSARHSTTVMSIRGSPRGSSFSASASPQWSGENDSSLAQHILQRKYTETALMVVREPERL